MRFTLATAGDAELEIYDLRGALVRRLAGGSHAAGPHQYVWDGRTDAGRPAASGVYACRLRVGRQVALTRVTLVR